MLSRQTDSRARQDRLFRFRFASPRTRIAPLILGLCSDPLAGRFAHRQLQFAAFTFDEQTRRAKQNEGRKPDAFLPLVSDMSRPAFLPHDSQSSRQFLLVLRFYGSGKHSSKMRAARGTRINFERQMQVRGLPALPNSKEVHAHLCFHLLDLKWLKCGQGKTERVPRVTVGFWI